MVKAAPRITAERPAVQRALQLSAAVRSRRPRLRPKGGEEVLGHVLDAVSVASGEQVEQQPADRVRSRPMARDQVGLMRELGFGRFGLVGHDRGARVAHRPEPVWVPDLLPRLEAVRALAVVELRCT